MDFITECSARAIGFKKLKPGKCPNKSDFINNKPRTDSIFKSESYWDAEMFIRQIHKTKDGSQFYIAQKEK